MAELPYVISYGKIPEYFSKIQGVGVPDGVTQKWLESVGFKSTNDRYLIAFLKDLGFADSSGKPTQMWRDYRHTQTAASVMAEAVLGAYPALFQLYANAHEKDDEAIRNWMRTHAAKASPTTIDRAVASFKGVSKLADFSSQSLASSAAASTAAPTDAPRMTAPGHLNSQAALGGASITINIELQLPPSASAEDYDSLFAAMRRHLFDGPEEAR